MLTVALGATGGIERAASPRADRTGLADGTGRGSVRDTVARTVQRHRSSPSPALIFGTVLAAAVLAGCSAEPDQPPALPSSFFSSATPVLTGATSVTATGPSGTSHGASGTPGALPTGSTGTTGADPGDLSRGVLSIRVTGGLRAQNTLHELISAVYSPPPGGIALVWTAGGIDPTTVGIGGASFVGTQPTAPTLRMTITALSAGGGFETFESSDGECTVTLGEVSASRIVGSFRCSSLRSSSGVTVDAAGTFAASG